MYSGNRTDENPLGKSLLAHAEMHVVFMPNETIS